MGRLEQLRNRLLCRLGRHRTFMYDGYEMCVRCRLMEYRADNRPRF